MPNGCYHCGAYIEVDFVELAKKARYKVSRRTKACTCGKCVDEVQAIAALIKSTIWEDDHV